MPLKLLLNVGQSPNRPTGLKNPNDDDYEEDDDVDGWWRGFLIRQEEGGTPTSPFLAFLLITPITILTILIIIVHISRQGGWVVRHLLTRGVDLKTLWIDWQCVVIKIYHTLPPHWLMDQHYIIRSSYSKDLKLCLQASIKGRIEPTI